MSNKFFNNKSIAIVMVILISPLLLLAHQGFTNQNPCSPQNTITNSAMRPLQGTWRGAPPLPQQAPT